MSRKKRWICVSAQGTNSWDAWEEKCEHATHNKEKIEKKCIHKNITRLFFAHPFLFLLTQAIWFMRFLCYITYVGWYRVVWLLISIGIKNSSSEKKNRCVAAVRCREWEKRSWMRDSAMWNGQVMEFEGEDQMTSDFICRIRYNYDV